MGKLYLNSKLYYKANREGWLQSLSYFCYLSSRYKNKRFNKTKTGLPKSSLERHLKVLKEKELVTVQGNTVVIGSHKEIAKIYGGWEKLFLNVAAQKDLKSIRNFLNSVPMISNLYFQQKKEKKKENFRIINTRCNKDVYVSKKDHKSLLNFIKKNSLDSSPIQLSIKRAKEVLSCSEKTAIKRKKLMEAQGIFTSKRNFEILFSNISKKDYYFCLNNDIIPLYSKYNNLTNSIYLDKATTFLNLV